MCQPQPPLLLWRIVTHNALGEKFAESFGSFHKHLDCLAAKREGS